MFKKISDDAICPLLHHLLNFHGNPSIQSHVTNVLPKTSEFDMGRVVREVLNSFYRGFDNSLSVTMASANSLLNLTQAKSL